MSPSEAQKSGATSSVSHSQEMAGLGWEPRQSDSRGHTPNHLLSHLAMSDFSEPAFSFVRGPPVNPCLTWSKWDHVRESTG